MARQKSQANKRAFDLNTNNSSLSFHFLPHSSFFFLCATQSHHVTTASTSSLPIPTVSWIAISVTFLALPFSYLNHVISYESIAKLY